MKTSRRIRHLFSSHDRWMRHGDEYCHCEGCYIDFAKIWAFVFASMGALLTLGIVVSVVWAIMYYAVGIGKSPQEKAADTYRAAQNDKIEEQKRESFAKTCEKLNSYPDYAGDWDCRKP